MSNSLPSGSRTTVFPFPLFQTILFCNISQYKDTLLEDVFS